MQSAPSRTERPETECAPARTVNGSAVRPGCPDRGSHVVGVRRVGDGGGVTVDRPVPAGAGGVVLGIGRFDDAADEAACPEAGGD